MKFEDLNKHLNDARKARNTALTGLIGTLIASLTNKDKKGKVQDFVRNNDIASEKDLPKLMKFLKENYPYRYDRNRAVEWFESHLS